MTDLDQALISSIWVAVIVPSATTIAALFAFMKMLLENQRLRLEIAKLTREAAASERRIHEPTPDEIEKYGGSIHRREWSQAIVMTVVVGAVIALSLSHVRTAISSRKAIDETQSAYRDQLESLRNAVQEANEARAESERQFRALIRERNGVEGEQGDVYRMVVSLRGRVEEVALASASTKHELTMLSARLDQATATVSRELKESSDTMKELKREVELLRNEVEALKQRVAEIEAKPEGHTPFK